MFLRVLLVFDVMARKVVRLEMLESLAWLE